MTYWAEDRDYLGLNFGRRIGRFPRPPTSSWNDTLPAGPSDGSIMAAWGQGSWAEESIVIDHSIHTFKFQLR